MDLTQDQESAIFNLNTILDMQTNEFYEFWFKEIQNPKLTYNQKRIGDENNAATGIFLSWAFFLISIHCLLSDQ